MKQFLKEWLDVLLATLKCVTVAGGIGLVGIFANPWLCTGFLIGAGLRILENEPISKGGQAVMLYSVVVIVAHIVAGLVPWKHLNDE